MTSNILRNKKVIIIGGASGIGLAVAQAAAHEGAGIVIASHRQEGVDQALKSLPQGASGRLLDVRDAEAVHACLDAIGVYDHLVFTAGDAFMMKKLEELTVDEAHAFFDIRYWGAFAAAKYGSIHIRKGGSMVFTSGGVSIRPSAGTVCGASVTAGIEAMTRALAVELAPQKIRVNAVRPGPVRTPLWDKTVPNPQEFIEGYGKQLLVGRAAEPEELAQAYLFLMKSGFTTGDTLTVDGGSVLV